MSEWILEKLGNILKITNGYAFKSVNFTNHSSINSLPVIKIKNVANGDVALNGAQYHVINNNLSKYIVKRNDLLIALTGNHPEAKTQVVGAISKLKLDIRAYLNQRIAKVDVLVNLADKNFIYYLFKENTFSKKLADKSSGSANQANISKSDIENIAIFIPPLPEQKAIASVLSSLDDKIDLLHRQNKTLESMAETLFRQWFIEDEHETSFNSKSLSEIAIFTNGLACQNYPVSVGEIGLPVLKIKELNSGITEMSDIASADVNPKYIVKHGDIIFSWSASLMIKIWSGVDCVLNQHLFNVKSDNYPKWFYYEWCKYHLNEFINISQSHATTMGHIKRKDLDEAMVKVPSDNILMEMTGIMNPLINQRIEKLKQIKTLEKLRDTLLPKLISGEVRVKYDTDAVA